MKLILVLALSIFVSAASAMVDGQDRGNGGDLCELRFNNVRDDIRSWIQKGGSKGLQLPSNLSLDQYNSDMLEQIDNAQVSCTEDKVMIGAAEKTCINFLDEKGQAKIKCNLKRFLDSEDSAQYVLVHHEYAGLAGFEVNTDEESDYRISNQISGYLETEESQKLVIKPPVSQMCNLLSSDLDKELIAAIARNELACIKVLAPLLSLNKPMKIGEYIPGTNWGDELSPMTYAAQLGHTDAIQILIDAGAYIHYENPKGGFAIAVAAFMSQPDSVKVLFKNGAFINYNVCSYGQYSDECHSPLGTALSVIGWSRNGKTFDTVETLLKLGANPNFLTYDQTPLAFATVDLDYVDLLMKYSTDPNLRNTMGRSAIFYCYTKNCVDKLVAVGGDVNQSDFEGYSPLDRTMGEGVREALLKHGARPGTHRP